MTKIEGTPESAAAEAGAWRCEICGTTLGGKTRRGRPRRYCSRACQQTAYRQRQEPAEDAKRTELWVALASIRGDLRDGRLAADLRGLSGDPLRTAWREAIEAADAVRVLADLVAAAPPVPEPRAAPPDPVPAPVADPSRTPEPAPEPLPAAKAPAPKPAKSSTPTPKPSTATTKPKSTTPALPGPVEMPEDVDARRRRAIEAWNGLNDRQRLYLSTIYDADQAAEANARGSWQDFTPSQPAEEWRWLLYTVAAQDTGHTTIQTTIAYGGQLDPGAGSTLAALAARGLVERTDDWIRGMFGMVPCVKVKLTPAGRAAARAGRGITAPASVPRGLTSEWVWSTLVKFYAADLADGFDTGPGPRRGPRPPSWNACLQLRNRRTGSFIEEDPLRISDLGREHYEIHWACYRELHPDVDAPEPAHRPDGVHAGLVDHRTPARPRGLLGRTSWRALDHLVSCHEAGESHLRYYLHGSHRDWARPAEIADLPHGSSRAALARRARSTTALGHLLDHRGVALAGEREVTHLNGYQHTLDKGTRVWIVWPTPAGLAHHAEHADAYRRLYSD